jgi:hypothetical protein
MVAQGVPDRRREIMSNVVQEDIGLTKESKTTMRHSRARFIAVQRRHTGAGLPRVSHALDGCGGRAHKRRHHAISLAEARSADGYAELATESKLSKRALSFNRPAWSPMTVQASGMHDGQ